jgi:hypothetical protein
MVLLSRIRTKPSTNKPLGVAGPIVGRIRPLGFSPRRRAAPAGRDRRWPAADARLAGADDHSAGPELDALLARPRHCRRAWRCTP